MSLPFEATHRAVAGNRKAVALALNVSESTVEAHCVRPRGMDGNGLASPAQRVIETILTLKAAGAEWLELPRYILREIGCEPPIPIEATSDPTDLDRVADAVREFGEFLAEVARGSADGILSPEDSERIAVAGEGVIGVLRPMIRAHQALVAEAEYAAERTRRGPKRAMPRLFELRRLA